MLSNNIYIYIVLLSAVLISVLVYTYYDTEFIFNEDVKKFKDITLDKYLKGLEGTKTSVPMEYLKLIKDNYELSYAKNKLLGPLREDSKIALCFPKTQQWNLRDGWLLHNMKNDKYYYPEGGTVILLSPDDVYEWLPYMGSDKKMYYRIKIEE